MFPDRIRIVDPVVVIRKNLLRKEFTFIHLKQKGEFFLVIPEKAKEVYYLQMLGKNIDLFIPADGEGLLVRGECLIGLEPLAD